MEPTSTTVGSIHLRKVIMAKASFSSGKLPMVASSSRWRSLIVPDGEQVTVNRNRKEVTCYEDRHQQDHVGEAVDGEGDEHLD